MVELTGGLGGKELAGDLGGLKRGDKRFKLLVMGLVLILVVALGFFAIGFGADKGMKMQGAIVGVGDGLGEEVSLAELREEVYPQFICGCCGNTIDKCACGMAEETKGYIDLLAGEGHSKDEIMLGAVKKFGLKSLADESLQEEIREEIVKSAPEDRPKIVIEPEVYDFGEVSQAEGVASASLSVRNEGTKDLVIKNMVSSCMCTTASMTVGGVEGPRFGMHDNPKWTTTLGPGERAKLKVYYDPNMHGDLKGVVIRTIDIFSNDPIDFQKQVRIELNQVA